MLFANNALGIEIYQNGFVWMLASGAKSSPVIERYETVAYPENILKGSLKDPNIIDIKALGTSISESYLKLSTDTKRVSMSIPDLSGRVMTLEIESLTKNKEEGSDQIKWKLKKSFPIDPNDLHLDYQVLKEDDEGNSTLLVALVSKSVINEYEELLLSSGLEPAKIDFATFNIYRLFSARLEVQEQLTLVLHHRGSLCVMVFLDGVLDFFRSKLIGTAAIDPVRLYREINSSFLVYSDSKGGWKPQKIFYYSSIEERPLFRSVIFEVSGAEPFLLDTDSFINSSRQQIDRALLPNIMSALGAASRGLR
jgi:type IV pilus assembly protein PilM